MSDFMGMTVDEYEGLPNDGIRTELVDGCVVVLGSTSLAHDLARDDTRAALHRTRGGVSVVEAEFKTTESRVRRVDVAWFRPGRLQAGDLVRSLRPVPDLTVEVVSPSDRAAELREKVHEYLEAGVTTVWLLYLDRREADIWNRGRGAVAGVRTLTADCLPGFELDIGRVFPASLDSAN